MEVRELVLVWNVFVPLSPNYLESSELIPTVKSPSDHVARRVHHQSRFPVDQSCKVLSNCFPPTNKSVSNSRNTSNTFFSKLHKTGFLVRVGTRHPGRISTSLE